MRKDTIGLVACLALFLSASVASAGVKNCNATLVNQNVCGDATQDVIYLRLAGTSRAEVVTALAKKAGWTANVTCTQTLVTAGSCTAEQIGQSIPNPETKPQAASRYLRELVREAVRGDKLNDIVTAGAASIPPAEVTD